jgi:hypothetical protein
MNEHDQARMKQYLRETMRPITGQDGAELRRDRWPTMLKRLEARSVEVPWFDWALIAAVAAWLVLFPGAIPVLLYHL